MAEEVSPGARRASDQARRIQEVFDVIRRRTDYTSKGLGVIGIAAVAGLGYANLVNDFPYGGPLWAVFATLLGVIAMVVAVAALFGRFNRANEAVITSPSYEETFRRNKIQVTPKERRRARAKQEGKKKKEEHGEGSRIVEYLRMKVGFAWETITHRRRRRLERELIEKIYGETASQQQVESLRAYEARGQRFERIASQSEGASAALLRTRADQILTEVSTTQDRAAMLLLRQRAHAALFGLGFFFWLAVFVAGWYATAVGADALQSDRSDRIEVAKLCAEARAEKKIAEGDLPKICGDPPQGQENKGKQTSLSARLAGLVQVWLDVRLLPPPLLPRHLLRLRRHPVPARG